jgi:ankyrin repeat protein
MLSLFGDIMLWSEWKTYDNKRPIEVAVEYGHRDIVKKYFSHHHSPKGIKEIVHAAVQHHRVEVLHYLQSKSLGNEADYEHFLHHACRELYGHQLIDGIVFEKEMLICDKNGFTPLMLTVKHRRVKAVRKLLSNNFCNKEVFEKRTDDGSERTVLHICAEVNENDITDVLLEKFHKLYKNDNKPWIMYDVMGNTPLHICAQKNNVHMCDKIMQCYKPNSNDSRNESSEGWTLWTMKNHDKWTALHEAIQHGHFDIVEKMCKLMNHKAFREVAAIVDEDLRTSLHMAAEKGQLMFEFLFFTNISYLKMMILNSSISINCSANSLIV